MAILKRVEHIMKSAAAFQVADIFHTASRQIVQNKNVVTAGNQLVRKVRPDESSSTCDE